MKLTEEEEALLNGSGGYAARKSMEILVALGRIYGAERLLPVTSVQVSGVSFHNLGRAGLEWLEQMSKDGRARAVATLNPAGMDLEAWREQGIDDEFAMNQLRVVNAYRSMGISASCTCTPYLVGNLPAPGESIAWSESSAVGYANTVLGARTNKEGGPSALAAALTGRTPAYGLHLDENRAPQISVRLELPDGQPLRGTDRWGLLGRVLGERTAGQVVRLSGVTSPTQSELKSLCAAGVTFGASPLIHIDGVTPEADRYERPPEEMVLTDSDLAAAAAALDDEVSEIDLVCLGCPHASISELVEIARLLEGKRVKLETWICTARATARIAEELGVAKTIEAAGAKLVCDTCFVVAPLRGRFRSVATDSVKGCFYSSGHNRLAVRLGSVERCLEAAKRGVWR